jgi:uncharacterized protein (DUF1501 family)
VDPGITLLTMSEFGRRVAQNAANGTDHGHGSCMFVLSGAAVTGVHTDWPSLEPVALDNGDLAITIDYRDVLAEVLAKRLGNPQLAEVFPNHSPRFHGVVRAPSGTVVPTPVPGATAVPTAVPTQPGGQERPSKVYLPHARRNFPDTR